MVLKVIKKFSTWQAVGFRGIPLPPRARNDRRTVQKEIRVTLETVNYSAIMSNISQHGTIAHCCVHWIAICLKKFSFTVFTLVVCTKEIEEISL